MGELAEARVDGHENLKALVRRLWLFGAGSPVIATTRALPKTHLIVESYVVLPSIDRPRFLLPTNARRAVINGFSQYLSTPDRRAQAIGKTLATAYRSRLVDRFAPGRLHIGIDRRVPRELWSQWLFLSHLGDVFDADDLVGILPVRRATPNAKPTVRLFDRDGTPQGYVKVGWSPPTTALVLNETKALRALDGGGHALTAPLVRAAGRWSQLEYLVATPLPGRIARWDRPPEASTSILEFVIGSADVTTSPLHSSAYRHMLHTRIERAMTGEPDVCRALADWLDRLTANPATLRFGRWHGDWVTWNLGTTQDTVFAWDWEYSSANVPAGFDLLHWHFQHRLAEQDGNLSVAADAVDRATHGLTSLGVPAENHALVASLYLLEMLSRAASLAAGGSGWNARLRPDLVRFVTNRDTRA